jgi:hypothetical protein
MSIESEALRRIKPSPTIGISAKARALKAAGRDIIALSAGELDYSLTGDFKVKVVSMREARFQTIILQKYDYSCGSAALASLSPITTSARRRKRPSSRRCSTAAIRKRSSARVSRSWT